MRNIARELLEDLADIIYPRLCGACDNAPVRKSPFCIDCLAELPHTGYHLVPENPFEMQFWGRVPITAGAALYYFIPGGRTQRLLHNLKYRGRRDLATRLGEFYAFQLCESGRFTSIDLIIPVPLHWRKRHQRGYNQSEDFARGLSAGLDVPYKKTVLRRSGSGKSLTSMSREERAEEVTGMFVVRQSSLVADKHVLLVDDVLTTGATLEECARVLIGAGAKISLCTLACGRI